MSTDDGELDVRALANDPLRAIQLAYDTRITHRRSLALMLGGGTVWEKQVGRLRSAIAQEKQQLHTGAKPLSQESAKQAAEADARYAKFVADGEDLATEFQIASAVLSAVDAVLEYTKSANYARGQEARVHT